MNKIIAEITESEGTGKAFGIDEVVLRTLESGTVQVALIDNFLKVLDVDTVRDQPIHEFYVEKEGLRYKVKVYTTKEPKVFVRKYVCHSKENVSPYYEISTEFLKESENEAL